MTARPFSPPSRRLSRTLALGCCAAALAWPTARLAAQSSARAEIGPLRIGFEGAYKLGCWTPLEVELRNVGAAAGVVEVIATDAEGTPVAVTTKFERPAGNAPQEPHHARLFIRPGQDGAPLTVRLRDARGQELASRTYFPGADADFASGLPATNRLIVTVGASRGLGELVEGESSAVDALATRAVRARSAADLPSEWYGYEGVELVVLSTAQPAAFDGLSANDSRIAALKRWVELGGRLVIFAGSREPRLLEAGSPLAPLLPGQFDAIVPLREAQPIETYVGTATADIGAAGGPASAIVSGEQFQLPVPRLVEVQGRILAHGGPNPSDLPLVVRSTVGLGEITFAAVDPDAPPLADWSGRTNLLRQALQWPAPSPAAEDRTAAYGQHDDLMDRLRRALDSSLMGIHTIPFSWVALAVVAYVALIGPGDFFLVKRALGRMQLTWVTFPVAAAAISAAAYWAAYRAKGVELRVNQVEVVDIDVGAGAVRGTVWTHFFNPAATRRDLRLAPRFGAHPLGSPETLVGWIGSTGFGLDGMQGRRGQLAMFDRGYAFTPQLDAMAGMPLSPWSTRTITGRWAATIEPPLEAELRETPDRLLAGHITNRTGLDLRDCVLMHANWAYKLPPLADGATASIDDSLQPRTVRTELAAGDRPRGDAAPRLHPLSVDVPQIVQAMLFYEAVGGRGYAQALHRYQSFVDLSRALRGDQAILLARAPDEAGSAWSTGDEPLASNRDRRWVYCRFIIPLDEGAAAYGPALPARPRP
ncbi:MAG: hypothetical protein DCC67_11305 [Planctomycetota bacterium]|nr:MAG: hypothetical protein DCC67_11305 [Planctomycetota bacterium]